MNVKKLVLGLLRLLALVLALVGLYVFATLEDMPIKPETTASSIQKKADKTEQTPASTKSLPAVSPDDWELVLVNRDHLIGDLVPELGYVAGVPVDSRIVEATEAFVVEVLRLDANEPLQGLYSGYRSVEEQEVLFQTRVSEEMAAGLTEDEAIAKVSETVLPAGASEHHTGLAIDMMRASDVATEIAKAAPKYGFVLRYLPGKEDITGVSQEDWHFRYVGVESAKYMTEHNLTLEEYLEELRAQQ